MLPVEQTTPAGSASRPFGKYSLRQRIGAGSMAEVFLAVATGPEGFQRSVVVKRMFPQLSQDPTFVSMFVDEIRVGAQLAHPNIVQVFDFGKTDQSYFIAMEHVQGRTLEMMRAELEARQRQMPIAASVEIARQVCTGLHYAHTLQTSTGKSRGIIHRDVSPANVMVDCHGVVKILDFGIARVADQMREARTQAGTVKAKIAYMSPEQLKLHEVDSRSDIFAIGVILHELLTGRRLFQAENDYILSRLVLEADIAIPSSVNAAVPAALDRVVMRALERDRDRRYATAAEMAGELEAVMAEAKLSSREHLKVFGELFPSELAEARMTVSGSHPQPNVAAADGAATPPGSEAPTTVGAPAALRPGEPRSTRAGIPVALGEPALPRRRKAIVLAAAGAAAVVALLVIVPLARHRGGDAPRHAPVAAAPAARPSVAMAPLAHTAPPPASAPAPQTVNLSIDSSPQDAEVIPVGADVAVGKTPLRVSEPRSTQPLEFRIQLPGYAPVTYKIIPDLDKSVRIDLIRLAVAQARPPAEEAPTRAGARPPAARKAGRPVAIVPGGGGGATAGVEKKCMLSVGSFPWARFFIDGKDTGQPTPVVHLPVTCGTHTLRFKRDDADIDEVVNISVTLGQEFRKTFRLDGTDDG
jgi:serine/threonine-protein kinase